MADTCRLCLSHNLVNNFIFDEDNKIYLKILSCLPVKVTRDDVLPKKICDVCSCKVDDFYQFCHKSIDSENRLHVSKMESNNFEIKDVNRESDTKIYQFSSSFLQFHKNGFTTNNSNTNFSDLSAKCFTSSYTQTGDTALECNIKLEPVVTSDSYFDNYEDDYSDQENNKMIEIKEEVVPPVKKVEKTASSKGANKRKTQRKLKKNKSIKIKIKMKKLKTPSQSKSDSEEDISLIDILKKDKDSKLNDEANLTEELIIDMKDIKAEFMGELTLINNQVPIEDGAGNAKEEWNCCICFLRSFDKEEMLAHYRLSHYSNKNAITCDELISEVIQNEKGESVNVFVCPHCNIKSNSKTGHLRHIRSHGLDKPFKCSLCEKTFRNAPEILKHGKNAHKYGSELQETVGKIEGDDLVGPTRSTKRFMCDLCEETFVYMKYVQIHRNLCHPEARERQFVNRCLHCGREFAHLNSLRRHLRSHSGEKNYLCYICGKSLSSREHLKFHIRIHTGFKPHICKTCGKGFVKKCNLTLHERVHSGEKPHVCSHCGKAFSQRSTLVIHERYHSGARPYVCNICNKGFVAKGLLSMHLKTSCI